jgi:carbon monoxide dehydrogenase subunit G
MDVAVTHTIPAPMAAVLAYLADLRNEPTWRKNTTSSDLVSGTPGAVGSEFSQVIMAMGNPSTVTVKLVEATEDRLQFRGEGGMMPVEVVFGLTSTSETSTDVTLALSIDIPPAMAKMAGRMISTENEKDLAQLAALLGAAGS